MPVTNASVAAAVRAEVARAGMTGRQLGRELGWTPGFVHRRMSGKDPFRVEELGQIADLLQIPVVTLLPEDPPPTPRPATAAAG